MKIYYDTHGRLARRFLRDASDNSNILVNPFPVLVCYERDGWATITPMPFKKIWVETMCMLARDAVESGRLEIQRQGNMTLLLRRGKLLSFSYPSLIDNYDPEVGVAVAYAKYRGWQLPDYI